MPANSELREYFSPRLAAMSIVAGEATPDVIEAYGVWLKTTDLADVAKSHAGSLKDDITGVWDGTGLREFYVHDAHLAHRIDGIRKPARALFALIADVEALGYANATEGWNATSYGLLAPLGLAMLSNVRRTSDNIGRSNGDEFTVIGLAGSSEIGPLLKVARQFATSSLGQLLADQRFLDFGRPSAGLLVKAATIPASTPWNEMAEYVDPKRGLEKSKYEYEDLPDGASLHRVYKSIAGSPFGKIGYLAADNSGGIFTGFRTIKQMSRDLMYTGFDPRGNINSEILGIDEVPSPVWSA